MRFWGFPVWMHRIKQRGQDCFCAEYLILLHCVMVQLSIKIKCNMECGRNLYMVKV